MSWSQERRAPVLLRGRWLVAGLAVFALPVGGVLFLRVLGWAKACAPAGGRAVHRARGVELVRQARPAARWASSCGSATTAPSPVAVTSVDAADRGVRLRMQDDGERIVDPGREVEIPLSVRLTCAPGRGRPAFPARRAGNAPGRRRGDSPAVDLEPAPLVRHVAATLCAVGPGCATRSSPDPSWAARAATGEAPPAGGRSPLDNGTDQRAPSWGVHHIRRAMV